MSNSSASFELDAVIVAQFDIKKATREAKRLGAIFNAQLAKSIKPINITANPAGLKRVTAEVAKLQKQVTALNKPLRSFEKGSKSAFSSGSKAATEYGRSVTRAGRNITTKLTTDTTSAFGSVARAASSAGKLTTDSFKKSTDDLKKIFDGVGDGFQGSLAGLAPAVQPALKSIRGLSTALLGLIAARGASEDLRKLAIRIIDFASLPGLGKGGLFGTATSGVPGDFKGSFEALDNLKIKFSETFAKIRNRVDGGFLGDLRRKFKDFGEESGNLFEPVFVKLSASIAKIKASLGRGFFVGGAVNFKAIGNGFQEILGKANLFISKLRTSAGVSAANFAARYRAAFTSIEGGLTGLLGKLGAFAARAGSQVASVAGAIKSSLGGALSKIRLGDVFLDLGNAANKAGKSIAGNLSKGAKGVGDLFSKSLGKAGGALKRFGSGEGLDKISARLTKVGESGTGSFAKLAGGAGRVIGVFARLVAATGPVGAAIAAVAAIIVGATIAITGLAAVAYLGGKAFIALAGRASDAGEAANAAALVLNGSNTALTELTESTRKYGAESTQAQAAAATFASTTAGQFNKLAAANDNFGLSQADLNKQVSASAGLLRNAGFEGEKLALIAAKNAQVARDMSSVYAQFSTQETSEFIAAGLRGETDSLERVGISISAASVEAEALALGYTKVGTEFSNAAKVAARASLIYKQADILFGDSINTAGSLANSQKNLGVVMEDTKRKISDVFLPAAEKISLVFLAVAQKAGPALVGFFERLKPAIDRIGGAITGAIQNFKAVFNVIQFLSPALLFIGKLIFKVLSPIYLILGPAIKLFAKQAQQAFETFISYLLGFTKGVNSVIRTMNKAFGTAFKEIDVSGLESALSTLKSTAKFEGIEVGNALKAGIEQSFSLLNFTPENLTAAAKALEEQFNNDLAAANQVLSAQKSLNDAVKTEADARKAAGEAAADSQQRISEIDAKLVELRKQRKDIQSGINGQVQAEAESLEKIRALEASILDLQQEREQAAFDEQRRRDEFQPRLAQYEDEVLLANIRIAQAKRDVEAAQKAINEAVSAGIPKEQFNVNLAGLSLDQIRVKLAQVRSTLAAQRQARDAVAEETTERKSQEELNEDLLTATIGVREAERGRNNLLVERTDFIRDNDIAQREAAEAVIESAAREAELNRDKATALREHTLLLKGEIGPLKEIRDITREIEGLERDRKTAAEGVATANAAIATAVQAVKIAQGELNVAISVSQGKLTGPGGIFESEIALLELKRLQTGAQDKTNLALDAYVVKLKGAATDQAALNRLQEDPTIRADIAVRDLFNNINPVTGQFQDPAKLDKKLGVITEGLKKILRDLGITALANGGVIDRPMRALVGEAGREVVLPLTRPGRMTELLGHKSVYPVVLAAMKGLQAKSSGNVGRPGLVRAVSAGPQVSVSLPTPDRQRGPSKADQKKQNQELAREIAAAVEGVLAKVASGGDTNHNTIQVSTKSDNAQVIARDVMRRLERKGRI